MNLTNQSEKKKTSPQRFSATSSICADLLSIVNLSLAALQPIKLIKGIPIAALIVATQAHKHDVFLDVGEIIIHPLNTHPIAA